MKMNKKGFTLIEMLVVIAIIAVLVAIIVPTVTNSTTKAKAATDAANLRSVISEANINILADDDFENTATASAAMTVPADYYTSTESKSNDGDMVVTIDINGTIDAYFGDPANNVAHYSDIAGNN